MSRIAPFNLPSNPSKRITFRAPNVGDCLDFCDLRPDLEESCATDYLRQLQVGEVSDPALWTAHDRITALWWIYVSISDDTTVVYDYECPHCGQRHVADIDLVDLDEDAVSLARPPFIEGVITCNGKKHPGRFVPLDGVAMMALEEKRLELADASDADARRIKAQIKVLEVVHSFRLDEHKGMTREEADGARMALVAAMDATNDYRPLVAKCLQAAAELRHGLATEIEDGELLLISPPIHCEAHEGEEGAAPATSLLMRFRGSNFIPEI